METIPPFNLLFLLIPLIFVWYFYKQWTGNKDEIPYATLRMVVQLILIGYGLIYIFNNDSWLIGILIIFVMVTMSTMITLRNIKQNKGAFLLVFSSIAIGGTVTLILVIELVLDLTPFYQPRYVIPLAGMIYANSMNSVSLAGERFEKEIQTVELFEARKAAFKASMIPKINALLAVGLVSLPGMMTGQILSGVDPLIAVRYQIVVMAMILSGGG
ncbi:MAG: ABC transporter permease, partial [Campylobacterales bacterium]|nr:ABC transporter permease [Campylobacterales bacterium]